MLAERIESWFDEATRKGMQHGMLQGQRQGEAAALTRVLRRRFGELSATDQARIAQAELAELECWLDRALVLGSRRTLICWSLSLLARTIT